MFTGIVEELGRVAAVDTRGASARLAVHAGFAADCAPGDSVAVNGVCLTVTDVDSDVLAFDVMLQTLEHTGLGRLRVGDSVNLERAMTLSSRLGGHVVQGHVDGVGVVVDRTPGEAWELVRVRLPGDLLRYVVDKGSVALDGVSLTVAQLEEDVVTVSLIPETLRRTTLGQRPPGAAVNVEVDVLARHVERLLEMRGVLS